MTTHCPQRQPVADHRAAASRQQLIRTRCQSLAVGLLALGGASIAGAAEEPPPRNVASLAASASVEVPRDWLTVLFSTSQAGADAAVVQSQLKQALDTALAEARKLAKPGEVEVQTGAFTLSPRYATPPQPRNPTNGNPPLTPLAPSPPSIIGWQGSTELIVEGRDTQAISKLTARIQALSIASVGFSLSRQARQQVEAEVTAQAIDRFRSRAATVSQQFGFGAYTVREVTVTTDSGVDRPRPMMRMQASAVMSDAPLPVAAGNDTVTATVNGSIQMAPK